MVNTPIRNRVFSITSFMILSIILIHMAVIPFLYQRITEGYKTSSSEQFISHNTEVSGLLADVLSTKSLSENRNDINDILNTAVLGGNIQFIEIQDHLGNTLSPADDITYSPETFLEDTTVNQNGDDIYYMQVPVRFKDLQENVSMLRIGFDESAIISDYTDIKEKVFYTLSIYLAVILIFIITITRYIHKPLYLLRDRSREVSNGNLDVPLGISSKLSEIQYLADDLEMMRSTLVDLAERMQHKATHDDLTNLPNRYLFNDRLEQSIAFASRTKNPFSVLLLDLDRFKEINDTLGHSVGDEVLRIISNRMHKGLRETDTIARIGGDEFCFILIGVGHSAAEVIAHKILELIEPEFEAEQHKLKVSASIGISAYPDDGENAELLIRRADVAMYHAKKNNLPLSSYYPDMDSDHYENLLLANDLKNSIIEGQFQPLYQPIINLLTGQVCGCELLLRWQHPTLGLIHPTKFIPIAERENLIGELTLSTISKHLHKFSELIKINENFHVSINVSPVNLIDKTLLNSISDILETRRFPRGNLYIEVTENSIMKNPARSAEILDEFYKTGIMVSIDDFGTGYSSLAYLQKFPICELKIDKSFVSDLTATSNNYPIVSATITMAHDLGISVVAEGVEDQEVLELLEAMGCDRVQGHLYTKPLDFEEMKDWLINYNNRD